MKLLEALQVVNENHSRNDTETLPRFQLGLSCGFVPLHFKTFLAAHTITTRPKAKVEIVEGLFGDVPGNLERLSSRKCDAIAAIIEWSDLDARLGVRSTGGWQPANLSDIVSRAELQCNRIFSALKQTTTIPRVVAGPTLPLPPVSYSRSRRLSAFEADLRAVVAKFHQQLLSEGVIVLGPQAVDSVSAPASRLDVKSELAAGFPYTLEHTEALARLVASEVCPPQRKKGLITDLDDTLWRGILGEIGVQGICWTLDRNAHIHSLYQQFLGSLAASGTLLAVASKNDPALVAEAFGREDLLLSKDAVFPVEAHWGAKSQSVARILSAWNVGADSVVFVDDSPMEVAEVQAAFPDMECLVFQRNDSAALWKLLFELRDKFGASELTKEDSLRLESLRSRALFDSARDSTSDPDAFLREAKAEIKFALDKQVDHQRAFELLNKTNQFNLNGARLTESEWGSILADPDRIVLKTVYSDRYGPLGNIAVLVATVQNRKITADYWVMSCRAFSRRIEHCCLRFLLDRFGAEEIALRVRPTPRNGPLQEFLTALTGSEPSGDVVITRAMFERNCPPLYHSVREIEK